MTNFVGREKERPTIGPEDIEIPDDHFSQAQTEDSRSSSRRRYAEPMRFAVYNGNHFMQGQQGSQMASNTRFISYPNQSMASTAVQLANPPISAQTQPDYANHLASMTGQQSSSLPMMRTITVSVPPSSLSSSVVHLYVQLHYDTLVSEMNHVTFLVNTSAALSTSHNETSSTDRDGEALLSVPCGLDAFRLLSDNFNTFLCMPFRVVFHAYEKRGQLGSRAQRRLAQKQ
eukprot:TRINITY_DN6404_c0_g1_i1.p1 TRINITY_DN6404_c0_g1~~TRINITY_DN6404_c0_g1_i1.p1  ORF type:complete len:230 (-),score=31.84 TRINITY_DN6404_c0_g1_i1:305-994(-)